MTRASRRLLVRLRVTPGSVTLSSLKTLLSFRSHPKAGAHVLAIPTSSLVLRTTNLRVRIIKKKNFFHFSPGHYFENLEIQMPVSGQCFASPRRNERCASRRRRERIEEMLNLDVERSCISSLLSVAPLSSLPPFLVLLILHYRKGTHSLEQISTK